MSQWIVFAASKGIGYHLVQYGLRQGHQVIAFIRNAKYKTRLTQIGLVTRQDIAIELSNIAENKLTYQQTYTAIDPNFSFNMK
ncbi:MAG: hypothetical protein ACL7AX_07855 [Candidatus Arsenophonus phytopathogenicus]